MLFGVARAVHAVPFIPYGIGKERVVALQAFPGIRIWAGFEDDTDVLVRAADTL